VNPVFTQKTYVVPFIPPGLPAISNTYTFKPLYLHILVLATFASLIAPFGGFFASGLKRTFKIKDFGDSIPGHGGVTDRMDCQFIMGTITFFYYSSFIAVNHATVGSVLEAAITGLTPEEQVEVIRILGRSLVEKDMLPTQVSQLHLREMFTANMDQILKYLTAPAKR
jgi:phosphatidate cytidylyltransferase